MNKTYLVTGGAGFIGSHLADKLLAEGHRVVCLDNFDDFYDPRIKRMNIAEACQNSNYKITEGDIRDTAILKKCFSEYKIQTVIHLAARAGVRPSIENPGLYYDVNVTGTLRLLEAMREADVKKMVFASSSSVYGNTKKVPFSETDNVDYPISPYAATKKACELMCYNYHHLHGMDIYCLRFFSVYGPRQRPDMAIHDFTKKILDDQTITLFGDGNSKRDYTYIDDIIQGLMSAADHVKGFEIINLGNSETISLTDLVKSIEKRLNKKAGINRLPMQTGDVEITYADIKKAKELLAYNPTFQIQEGLKRFTEWMTRVG